MKEHQNNRQTPRILPCRDRPSPVLKFLDPPLGYDHKIFKYTINYIYTDRLNYATTDEPDRQTHAFITGQ